jgi:hypothetical protein
MIAVFLAAILQAGMPMHSIDKGLASNVDAARQVAVRSADEWSTLWTQHGGDRAKPSVDFSKDIVLAVFMGSRSSGGFTTEITGVRQDGATLVVSYKETRPAPDSVAAQILTSPYHIVAVPKGAVTSATTVKFELVK